MLLPSMILAALVSVATTGPVSKDIEDRLSTGGKIGSAKLVGVKEKFLNNVNNREEHPQLVELFRRDTCSRNSLIEGVLWGLVDDLRDLIVNGSDEVPVLDPFKLDELLLDADDLDLPNSHISLKNIKVLNLGSFKVDQLTVSLVNIILQRYRLNLDMRIPSLDTQAGKYDLSLNVMGGNIFGNGKLKLNIVNPRVYGHLVFGMRITIHGVYLTIHECRLNFSLKAFEFRITGMFGNEVASEFVSSFLSSLIPEMVEYFKEDISDALSNAVKEIANDILQNMNIARLL